MARYIEIIKFGIIIFPIIAGFITLPYLLFHYHKYGSLPFIRVLIVYSFILYLLIAYFEVILPLPHRWEVQYLTTPTKQLELFHFVDQLKIGIQEVGYRQLYKTPVFYTTFLNFCLTIPFGAYMKFYFKQSFVKTLMWTFLLSLFFELTQITGLYFIYSRPYRLFDVDDLLINTLGAIPGFIIGWILSYFVPNLSQVNDTALVKGRRVSVLRRFVSFGCDALIYSAFSIALCQIFYFIPWEIIMISVGIVYYFLIPLSDGQTISNMFLNIRIMENTSKFMHLKTIIIRQCCFGIQVIGLPILFLGGSLYAMRSIESKFGIVIFLLLIFFVFIYYLLIAVRMTLHEDLFYDRMSNSRIVSTIKRKNSKQLQAILDNAK